MNDILKSRFDVEVPPRCTLHQCVKGKAVATDPKRRCVFCQNYTLSLKCDTCLECLSTEELCNFKVDEYVAKSEFYKHFGENE